MLQHCFCLYRCLVDIDLRFGDKHETSSDEFWNTFSPCSPDAPKMPPGALVGYVLHHATLLCVAWVCNEFSLTLKPCFSTVCKNNINAFWTPWGASPNHWHQTFRGWRCIALSASSTKHEASWKIYKARSNDRSLLSLSWWVLLVRHCLVLLYGRRHFRTLLNYSEVVMKLNLSESQCHLQPWA